MKRNSVALALFAGLSLLFLGCHFDCPLTAKPTRPIEERLVGNWISSVPENQAADHMNVRKLDAFTYIVSYDGDLYRAFHSDFEGKAFLSVQDLNPAPGRYLYLVYRLSDDGSQVVLTPLNPDLLPSSATDQASIQDAIRKNLSNPKLFGEEMAFRRLQAR